jgi:MFS family permease
MGERLKLFRFQENANLYLKSIMMSSLAQGAYGVIQGLYILSLGFDESILGTILSARMLAAAFASIPAGIISDTKGRRPVLIAGGILTTVGYTGMALSSSPLSMILFSCVVGVAQACQMTSGAPLMAETSSPEERPSLFGVNFSLSMFANMAGSLIGGFLPQQLGFMGQVTAFRVSLALFSIVTLIGVFPVYKIVERQLHLEEGKKDPSVHVDVGDEESSALEKAKVELKGLVDVMRNRDVLILLAYSVLIGFGAGLVVPFFNVFLSGKLQVDSGVVGLILSLSQGATAIAGLIAPILANKYGKVKTVVGTQLASIPFLLLIALPPNIYLVSFALFMRSALMNMSNPVASNFSMEIVEADKRGKISSLMRISDNIARSLSAYTAGYIMSRYNYEIPYFITAVLYFLASVIYWKGFGGREEEIISKAQ